MSEIEFLYLQNNRLFDGFGVIHIRWFDDFYQSEQDRLVVISWRLKSDKMKKILVPIDFSPAARYGFEYAEWLSLSFLNDIKALHVATPPHYEETLSASFVKQFKQDKKNAIEQHLKRFTTPYPDHQDEALTRIKNLECETHFGEIVPEILNASKKMGADLIVIGTRKKHNIWDHLFGSVTTQLIEKSTLPILVIPEGCAFHPIKQIAFATAITGSEPPVLSYLSALAKQLQAEIKQVYVNTMPYDLFDNKEEIWQLSASNSPTQNVNMIREPKVEKGLDLFVDKHRIDLLAMMIPKRSKLEQYWRKSNTKKMAYKTHLPLLLIPES